MPGKKLLLHNCGPTTGLPGQRATKPGRFWFSVPRPYVIQEPRLGRIGCMLPEFIISRAGSWLGLSVCIERITQSSSIHLATSGYSSETSMPLLPYDFEVKGEGINPPRFFRPLFC